MLAKLPAPLLSKLMEKAEPSLAFDDTNTTTLMCLPLVTFDAYARQALKARDALKLSHAEIINVLLDLEHQGRVILHRDGRNYFFQGV